MKIKLLNNKIQPPSRGTEQSAGIDLRLSKIKEYKDGVYTLCTGVAVEIPDNHVGLLAVRSSTGSKGLQLTNSVGIIDSDYRGEVMLKCTFKHIGHNFPEIGDRIAQLVVVPCVIDDIEVVEELSNTIRGAGGFGHSGRS